MKSGKIAQNPNEFKQLFIELNLLYLEHGLSTNELQQISLNTQNVNKFRLSFNCIILSVLVLFYSLYEFGLFEATIAYFLGIRCVIPNNYFVWEATRPVNDCTFCKNLNEALILPNLTKDEFAQYAYTSTPIIIKNAFTHWPAMQHFDYYFFKHLYNNVADSYKSVDEECQFLHFKSNFISLKDVFSMDDARIQNEPQQKSWYVGWGNCHPQILNEMRKYYPKPHFLPDDCEIPSKEYVFMGYDDGATMHLDFINRLMWQAQLKGTKTWHLIPAPECQNVCSKLNFTVEPGDAVLVDTRIWYHGTTIMPGEFSLSIQSEYG